MCHHLCHQIGGERAARRRREATFATTVQQAWRRGDVVKKEDKEDAGGRSRRGRGGRLVLASSREEVPEAGATAPELKEARNKRNSKEARKDLVEAAKRGSVEEVKELLARRGSLADFTPNSRGKMAAPSGKVAAPSGMDMSVTVADTAVYKARVEAAKSVSPRGAVKRGRGARAGNTTAPPALPEPGGKRGRRGGTAAKAEDTVVEDGAPEGESSSGFQVSSSVLTAPHLT